MSDEDTTEPVLDDTEAREPNSIADEWADEYPEGAQLFCARFDADDFDSFWGEAEHPDGETIAVRAAERPSSGFFARNRERSPQQLGFDVIERHMSDRAREIFYDLNDEAQSEFVERWSGDTFDEGSSAGKVTSSNRSSRRAANRKRR